MLLKNLNLTPFFESGATGAFGTKGDLAILADGDDNVDDTAGKEDKSEDDVESDNKDDEEVDSDKSDEESEDSDESTEDSEEEATEDTETEDEDSEAEYKAVPQVAEIKKAFPDLFKKFPEVRAAIFRDQQFSEVFNSPKEAEVASRKAETLDSMEADLMDGSSEQLFTAIKKSNPESYNKLSANLLSTLQKIDKDLYLKIVAVPFKQALRAAVAKGKKNEDKNLEFSAYHLHKFLFDGDDNVEAKAEFETDVPKKSDAETKLEKELEARDARDLNNFQSSVNTTFEAKAEKEFALGLDDSIAPRIQKYMFAEAMKEINEQLGADKRYQGQMRQLWISARKTGFSSESKAKIVSTALARAKQLIPVVRAKIKKEMNLKSDNKVVKQVRREAPRVQNNKQRNDKPQSDLDIIRS